MFGKRGLACRDKEQSYMYIESDCDSIVMSDARFVYAKSGKYCIQMPSFRLVASSITNI